MTTQSPTNSNATMTNFTRKEFLRTSAMAGIGLGLLPMAGARGEVRRQTVRIGLVGVGARGTGHLRGLLVRDDVEIPAVCDVDQANLDRAVRLVEEAGHPRPEGYTGSDSAWEGLVSREDLDGVIISTPWLFHTPIAVAAMEHGMYVGSEIPTALTMEDCWNLVRTSERTGSPLMQLENVCYRRDVMAVLQIAREGLLGTLLHARCGYRHDLRDFLFDRDVRFGPGTGSVSSWRTQHYIHQNRDLYPNHGIGPVAHWLDINRGNRFLTLTSAATKSAGLQQYIREEGGADNPHREQEFRQGDVVTTMLTTANGETVIVTHDTSGPRPYSLDFQLQGTRGLWLNDRDGIHIEGRSEPHRWEDFADYHAEHDSALWRRHEEEAVGSGHGGMDFFIRHAFVESVKRQVQPPIDVYDAATWSAIGPLSEDSIALGSQTLEFPDFTGGRWTTNERIFYVHDEY